MPSGPLTTARRLDEAKSRARAHRRPESVERTRLPFFSADLLHHVDLKCALGDELLELRVLLLQVTQPLHIGALELAVALAPAVDRCVRDPMLLGYLRHRCG